MYLTHNVLYSVQLSNVQYFNVLRLYEYSLDNWPNFTGGPVSCEDFLSAVLPICTYAFQVYILEQLHCSKYFTFQRLFVGKRDYLPNTFIEIYKVNNLTSNINN